MHSNERNYQQAFEPIYGSTLVEVTKSKEKGSPFISLSQSKLELLGAHLDKPILNPTQLSEEQLTYITAGIILHQIAQTTSTWRSILPHSPVNYQEIYTQNLKRRLQIANPSTKHSEMTTLYYLLNDERLAFPSVRGAQFDTAKQNIYHIIAERIINLHKTMAPFSDTPVLNETYDDLSVQAFPKPEKFCQTWTKLNQENTIYDRTNNLLKYHESLTVHPSIISHHSPGQYAQELRSTMFLSKLGAMWTTRFDEIYFNNDLDTGKRRITIHDYKLNYAKLIKKESYAKKMQQLSLFLTAMAAYSLPQTLEIDGKSVQTPYLGIDKDTEVIIKYFGLKSVPPQTINFTKYYRHLWTYLNPAEKQMEFLNQTLDYINRNKESLTHIFPPRKAH